MPRTRKKLYLNENISHKLVAVPLRELGYDVISSHEAGMDELDDYSQLAFAARRKRILVTFNRDDFVKFYDRSRIRQNSGKCFPNFGKFGYTRSKKLKDIFETCLILVNW